MRFSIITVCLNCEHTIESTIHSVLAQSFTDYEYWIIDGNSTDRTREIAERHQAEFKGRMHFLSEADCGIFDAMNRGIALARGEYLYFLNSDDQLEPEALAAVDAAILHHPGMAVYYGDMRLVDTADRSVKIIRPRLERLKKMPIHHQSCFFARDCFQKYGNYNLAYPMAADYDHMLKMYLNDEKFKHIGKIVANYKGFGASANNVQSVKDLYGIKHRYGLIGRHHKKIGELFYMSQIKIIKWIDKWRKLLK